MFAKVPRRVRFGILAGMRVVAILLVAALSVAGCSPETPERLSVRAEEAYAQGDYAKAIAAYERLLQVYGENAVTYANLALAALRAQDTEYAKRSAEKALALDGVGPQAELTRELLGMVAEAEKDLPGAARLYRALAQAKDAQVRLRARSRLARIYADQGRADGALALLLAAANERPTDATTLYNLGNLCVREPLRMRQAALDYFRQAERLLPKDSREARKCRDWVTRLEANLARLRQVPPSGGDAKTCAENLRLARDAKAKKRWRSAETYARKAAQADPSSYEAALELGRTCAQNSHRDAALKAYDAALVLRPGSTDAHAEAAQLAYDAKRYGDAVAYLRPLLTAQPRNRFIADLMMRILTAQRKLSDARVWGEYYLALDPKAPASYRKWVDSLPEE